MIDQMHKLTQLIQRAFDKGSFDDERYNAFNFLGRFLEKYNISPQDISVIVGPQQKFIADQQAKIRDLSSALADRENELTIIRTYLTDQERQEVDKTLFSERLREIQKLVLQNFYPGQNTLPHRWEKKVIDHFVMNSIDFKAMIKGKKPFCKKFLATLRAMAPLKYVEPVTTVSTVKTTAQVVNAIKRAIPLTDDELYKFAKMKFEGLSKDHIVKNIKLTDNQHKQFDNDYQPRKSFNIKVLHGDQPTEWFELWEMIVVVYGKSRWRNNLRQHFGGVIPYGNDPYQWIIDNDKIHSLVSLRKDYHARLKILGSQSESSPC